MVRKIDRSYNEHQKSRFGNSDKENNCAKSKRRFVLRKRNAVAFTTNFVYFIRGWKERRIGKIVPLTATFHARDIVLVMGQQNLDSYRRC